MYKIDLDNTNKDFTPTFIKLDGITKESLMKYILDPEKKDNRIKFLTRRFIDYIGKNDPIPHIEIEKYVTRVISDLTEEQIQDMLSYENTYAEKIKEKNKCISTAIHGEEISGNVRY